MKGSEEMQEMTDCEIAVQEAKRSTLLECLVWLEQFTFSKEKETALYIDMKKRLECEISALK